MCSVFDRCSSKSVGEENFICLSLDLIDGGSIQDMLQVYMMVRPTSDMIE